MYLVIFYLACGSIILVDSIKLECEHSSREYQVVLRSDIMTGANSFVDGVMMVIDELTAIERAGIIDFQVNRSSLKITNITVVKYQALLSNDLRLAVQMKSRQKKTNEPADFVFKISNADPILACVSLDVASVYVNNTDVKFELDFHAVNGKTMSKSAISYKIMPKVATFNPFTQVNTTSLLTNARQILTYSGSDIIAVPGIEEVQFTAEFDVRLANKKHEATIFLLKNAEEFQCEFSIRIKGYDVNPDHLIVAEQVVNHLSLIRTIIPTLSELTSDAVPCIAHLSFILKAFFPIYIFSWQACT